MNCKKCNAELSSSAKFCAVCGTPVEQAPAAAKVCSSCGNPVAAGTKFCGVCGTVVDAPAAAAPVAPVIPAMPVAAAAPQPANDVAPAAVPQPANDVAPAAVPQPVNDVAPAAVPQPVNDVAPAAVPQPANDVVPAAVPQPTNDAMPSPVSQPVYNAMPAPASVVNGIDMQVAGLDMDAASVASVKPIKKGKLGLWIALGVVGVAAAAAAVGGLFFRGTVANLFMGDNKYAAMVEGNAIKTVTESEEYQKYIETYAETLSATMSSAVATANLNNVNMDSSSPFAGMDLEGSIAAYNEQMLEIYGVDGVTMTFDFDVKLEDALKNNLGENLDELLAIVNDSEFTVSVQAAADAVGAELAATDKEGFTFDARGVVYKDGTVAAMFPFASDKCIKATFDADGNVTSTEEITFEVDPAEMKRISTDIIGIYLKYIELADVTVDKGSIEAADVKAEARLISVYMDEELVSEMVVEMLTYISEDSYINEKIENLVEIAAPDEDIDLEAEFDELIADVEENEVVSFLINTVVDNNGNILAKSYGMEIEDEGEATVTFAAGENEQGLQFNVEDDVEDAEVVIHFTQDNETDGKIRVEVEDSDTNLGFNIDYEGVQTVPYLNSEAVVGEFTFYYAGTEDSEEFGSAITVELSTAVDGDKMTNVIGVEVSEYCDVEMEMTFAPATLDITEIPSGASDFSDNDSWTEDEKREKAQYMLDMMNDIKAKCDANSSSTFAGIVAPLAEQAITSLNEVLTPKVDVSVLSAQADRISELMNKLDDSYTANSQHVSEDLLDECIDTYSELENIYDDVAYEYEMEQAEFDEIVADVDALEARVNTLCDEIQKQADEAKNAAASQGEALIGMWTATMISGFGETMTAEEADFSMYVFFYDDGSYLWNWDGEVTTGTWSMEDTLITLVEEDWYYEFEFVNGNLTYLADADITIHLDKM